MTAFAALIAPAELDELHRRDLMAESDRLLEQVEELRLAGQPLCPPLLGESIRKVLLTLGRVPTERPRSVRAAHALVFAAQARLMAGNPRQPRPRPQPDRPAGVPRLTVLRPGGAWKFLALPPAPVVDEPAALARWRHLVELTVGRALDRWVFAQSQAVHAVRSQVGAGRALDRAGAAWRNYWELRCEAESLLRWMSPPSPRAGRRGRATRPAAGAGIESSRCSRS